MQTADYGALDTILRNIEERDLCRPVLRPALYRPSPVDKSDLEGKRRSHLPKSKETAGNKIEI
jgi:hypothetical protein